MALTVWEVRTGGAATNGGGFDSSLGGTDYTLQTSPQATGTATASGTTLTATTGIFTSQMVGNYVTDGTTWAKITAYTSSTVVTLGSSPGWTAASIAVGGALNNPATILGTTQVAAAGDIVFVQNGTYTSTTTRTIGADGSQSAGLIYIIGYSSTRTLFHDELEANMPLFTTATNSVSIFSFNGASFLYFANIKVTVTAASRGSGFVGVTSGSVNITFVNCVADGCAAGFHLGGSSSSSLSNSTYIGCTARNCNLAGFYSTVVVVCNLLNCHAHANAVGMQIAQSSNNVFGIFGCVIEGNTGNGLVANNSTFAFNMFVIDSCVFANNGAYGISWPLLTATNDRALIRNCIFSNNTSGDIYHLTASINELHVRINNFFYTVGTRYTNISNGINDVTLSADPFVNSAGHDFELNNIAGAGALVRNAAYPQRVGINGSLTNNYMSGGAAQLKGTNKFTSAFTGGFDG